MALLGENRENFSLPLCSAFQPRYVDGQRCYYVDLTNVTGEKPVRQGAGYGLTLFIDTNDERMVNAGGEEENQAEAFEANIHGQEETNDLKIIISTLEPFTGYGGGHYEMSSVQVITTTDDFLALPESVRGCQTEQSALECRLDQFRTQAEQCGCQPFALLGLFNHSVVREERNSGKLLLVYFA